MATPLDNIEKSLQQLLLKSGCNSSGNGSVNSLPSAITPITFIKNGKSLDGSLVQIYDGNTVTTHFFDIDGEQLNPNEISDIIIRNDIGYKPTLKHLVLEPGNEYIFTNLTSFSLQVLDGIATVSIDGETVVYPVENITGFNINFDRGINDNIEVWGVSHKAHVICFGDVEVIKPT